MSEFNTAATNNALLTERYIFQQLPSECFEVAPLPVPPPAGQRERPTRSTDMGGECFRYVQLKRTDSAGANMLPEPAKEIYASTVLPQLVQAVNSWKGENVLSARWHVRADLSSGIHIRYAHRPGSRECSADIVCPPSLDKTLWVGWQHHRYASIIDPKYAIAQTLMGIVMRSPLELLQLLDDEEMDEVWKDLWLPESNDGYDNAREERDYTACSAEDCGYCGRCPY